MMRASSIKGNGWSKPTEKIKDNPGTQRTIGKLVGKMLRILGTC